MASSYDLARAAEERKSFLTEQQALLQAEDASYQQDAARLQALHKRNREELSSYLLDEVSDAHLRGPDDPGLAALCARIGADPAPAVALLGDLLHAGWSWRSRSPVDDVLHAILDAVAGRTLLICPGNHDFGLRWPALPQLCVAERHHVEQPIREIDGACAAEHRGAHQTLE